MITATSMPARYWKRKDDSLGMAFGDQFKGPHEQFDFEGSEEIAALIVNAVNCHEDLVAALIEATKALETASRSLTEDHRLVLNGKRWGGPAIEKAKEALAKAGAA